MCTGRRGLDENENLCRSFMGLGKTPCERDAESVIVSDDASLRAIEQALQWGFMRLCSASTVL